MFGYVRIRKAELLVRQYEDYGGVYCSLCRRLGRDYGVLSRLFLNYDCTFYSLVFLAAAQPPCPAAQKGRCVVNPLKRCVFFDERQKIFEGAAAFTVLLTYYKIRDDLADSGFWRSLPRRLALPAAALAKRKAEKRFPALGRRVRGAMESQSEVERLPQPGIDQCAEPTAGLLAEFFSSEEFSGIQPESSCGRVLRQVGYYLGRWTYLMDAADDLEEDIRSGAFNPLARKFRLDRVNFKENYGAVRTYANQLLNETLARLGAAADLLDMNRLGPVVRNVIFLGLPQMQRQRLFEKENGNV